MVLPNVLVFRPTRQSPEKKALMACKMNSVRHSYTYTPDAARQALVCACRKVGSAWEFRPWQTSATTPNPPTGKKSSSPWPQKRSAVAPRCPRFLSKADGSPHGVVPNPFRSAKSMKCSTQNDSARISSISSKVRESLQFLRPRPTPKEFRATGASFPKKAALSAKSREGFA